MNKIAGLKHFLRWLCICLTIIILGAAAVKFIVGGNPLAEQDIVTYAIYIGIVASFIWSTLRCGLASHLSEDVTEHSHFLTIQHIEREGWFWSATCASLGLIGTIWGMILMTTAFTGFNPDNNIQLLATIGSGMGTALYTTLLGQICSQILNMQYFGLSQTIEKVKNHEE
jgi:NADH:ubiquinone oxidoreductase subunit 6 (subunit J)